jgi:hypothetical protein
MQDNKTSSLQKHLIDGDITALETALKLEPTIGFTYSDYKYYSYDWDSEEDYYNFINTSEKSSSISGHVYDRIKETSYDITIILYKGRYFTQVEKYWDYSTSNISYNCDSFEDYLSALKFAYNAIFN